MIRNLLTVLGFAAASAVATYSLVSPSTTFADNEVQITAEGTKIGHVLLNGKIEKDATSKTGWAIVVTAENKGDAAENVPFQTDLRSVTANPMARVRPMPTTVWNQKEDVVLQAHQKITKKYEIPAAIAANIAKSMQPPSKDEANQPPFRMPPRTSFIVFFEKPVA